MKRNDFPSEEKESPMLEDAPVYIYATELVGNYYQALEVKDKNVLTVLGSGDQLINAFFLGADRMVGFDLNKNSKFITELKIEAIKRESYENFMAFFGSTYGNASFDYDIYNGLKKSLSEEAINFFEKIYGESKISNIKPAHHPFIRQRDFFDISPQQVNFYLTNEDNFEKSKRILSSKQWSFIQSNADKISKKLSGQQFDLINLSNVPNYFYRKEKDGASIEVLTDLLRSFNNFLKPSGQIFYYSYAPESYEDNGPPASRNETLSELKKALPYDISVMELSTSMSGLGRDRIVILKKQK